MTNEERAERASAALDTYCSHVGDMRNAYSVGELVSDMICDLLHYAASEGENVDSLIASGRAGYGEEGGAGSDPLGANRLQKAALSAYASGDYASAESESELSGDTLALFIWRELQGGPDTLHPKDASERLTAAMRELRPARDAVLNMNTA